MKYQKWQRRNWKKKEEKKKEEKLEKKNNPQIYIINTETLNVEQKYR